MNIYGSFQIMLTFNTGRGNTDENFVLSKCSLAYTKLVRNVGFHKVSIDSDVYPVAAAVAGAGEKLSLSHHLPGTTPEQTI